MNDKTTVPAETQHTDKLAWERPTIEELDFGATDASYIAGGVADFGIYTV